MPETEYEILEVFKVKGPEYGDFSDEITVKRQILGRRKILYIFPKTMYGEIEFKNSLGDEMTFINSEEYKHPNGKIYTRVR